MKKSAFSLSIVMIIARCFIQRASAWVCPSSLATGRTTIRLITTTTLHVQVDDQGRTIRTKQRVESNDDNNGGWDDFDPLSDMGIKRTQPARRTERNDSWGGAGGRGERSESWNRDVGRGSRSDSRGVGGRGGRSESRGGAGGRGGRSESWGGAGGRGGRSESRGENRYSSENSRDQRGGRGSDWDRNGQGREQRAPDDRRMNINALEGAGFVHLYGLASCLNALQADRRDFTRPETLIDVESMSGEALEHEKRQRERKPEAQFSPYLFVQDRGGSIGERSEDKAMIAKELERLAAERGIPVAKVDKGSLNALAGNRPHQGYVLRCGKLEFESLPKLPMEADSPNLWLVLDEVMDPQNLGALLRSAYFMGGSKIGVLVCAKNSAPPSAVVSAASAGALESIRVYSTSNLPRTLNAAKESGFRVIGASSSIPTADAEVYDLNELPSDDRKTVLVLGSEGSGLRTLVARACTDFVKIPGIDDAGVDSLNVSVTGGILLWHLVNSARTTV